MGDLEERLFSTMTNEPVPFIEGRVTSSTLNGMDALTLVVDGVCITMRVRHPLMPGIENNDYVRVYADEAFKGQEGQADDERVRELREKGEITVTPTGLELYAIVAATPRLRTRYNALPHHYKFRPISPQGKSRH